MKLLGVISTGLLLLKNNVQGRVSNGYDKRSASRDDRMADFDITDLADLSSIPGYDQPMANTRDVKIDSDLDTEEEFANFVEPSNNVSGRSPGWGKRSEGDFNVADLVDWDSVQESLAATEWAEGDEATDMDDVPGDHLNPNDFSAAEIVSDKGYDFELEDPILSANLFEGDIANVNLDALRENVNSPEGRNAIRDSNRKWPGGVIPYVISGKFNSRERSIIAKAFKNYHDKTCIKFVPRTNERGYINIMQGSGCSSSVGRTGWSQQVSLGRGCVYTGIVMHELMHASGFWHEQSRADRDRHITINWANIQSGMEFNFLKYDLNKIDHLGADYDTCSVMHYGSTAFAKVSRY